MRFKEFVLMAIATTIGTTAGTVVGMAIFRLL